MGTTRRIPIAPEHTPLRYLLWDGTDPVDSHAIGDGLTGWDNVLDTATLTSADQALVDGTPKVFLPERGIGSTPTYDSDAIIRFPRTYLAPFAGSSGAPDVFAISGHGIPGFMFTEASILMAASQPTYDDLDGWRYTSNPRFHPSPRIVIHSNCRQLEGAPRWWQWAKIMRGSDPPPWMILSYWQTAPSAEVSARINRRFLSHLARGETLLDAWRLAHSGDLWSRWAALSFTDCAEYSMLQLQNIEYLAVSERPANDREIRVYLSRDDSNAAFSAPVRQPTEHFDAWLARRDSSHRYRPWQWFARGRQLDLHVKLRRGRFDPGDRLYVAALQVRPDYGGPFSIENLFTIDSSIAAGAQRLAKLQSTYGIAGDDIYTFLIEVPSSWQRFSRSRDHIAIPIRLTDTHPNDHLRLYYFMFRLEKLDGTSFGLALDGTGSLMTTSAMRPFNEFQYAVFRM